MTTSTSIPSIDHECAAADHSLRHTFATADHHLLARLDQQRSCVGRSQHVAGCGNANCLE